MDIGRLVNAADIAADVLRAQTERIAKLERLVRDARPMVCSSRYVMVADNWLTRYDEMFPEVSGNNEA